MSDVAGENIDLGAEKTIIGSLLGPEGYQIWVEISDILTPNTFIADTHQVVYSCLDSIYKETPDIKKVGFPLVLNKSKSLNYGDFLDKKDEKAYLKEIIKYVADKATCKLFSKKLRKLEITRLIRSQLEIANSRLQKVTGDETASSILSIAEEPIIDLSRLIHGFEGQNTELMFETIEEWVEDRINNPRKNAGYLTGWDAYDAAIGGGLRPGTVNVIASRFGEGKSTIGENMAHNLVSQNINVLVLDSEMSKEERFPRDLALVSGVSITEIEQGLFGKDARKVKLVREAAKKWKTLSHLYSYRNICGMEFDEITGVMKNWVLSKVGLNNEGYANESVIVFDYLKIQNSSELGKNIAETQMLGLLTSSFVNFCQKYKVAGLTFAQMNREGLTSEESNAIAASDRIGWFASTLALTKAQSDEEIAAQRNDYGIRDPYDKKMIILKSRHGPGLDRSNYINLRFKRFVSKFECGPTQFDLVASPPNAGQQGMATPENPPEF